MSIPTLRTLSFALITVLPTPSLPGQIGGDAPKKPAEAKKPEELPPPPPLGKAATEAMVARYETSEHWVQKVVILLSLNHYWHPSGSTMILHGIRDSDKRLRAYAIEALLRSEDGLLPTVASAELVEELIKKQLSRSNKHYRSRVLAALTRIAPEAKAEKKSDWTKWWRATKDTYKPKPWQAKPTAERSAGNNTVAFVERAFDLYTAGLDLGLCIDSTGSMQPSIDAVSKALDEMVDILKGISPKFRLGIVHYKEKGDFGDGDKLGARVITPLTNNVGVARRKLLRLKAKGGGDLPEQVRGGLEIVFGKRMKWKADANKIVIVIGDAPPHNAVAAKEIVEKARTDPRSLSNRPTTGKSGKFSPFVTSAIGVLLEFKDGRIRFPPGFAKSQRQMQKDFASIAAAGGGVYAEIALSVTVDKKGQIAPTEGDKGDAAARKMVEHILVLSFGRRFVREMRAFVKIYYDYKSARWFK